MICFILIIIEYIEREASSSHLIVDEQVMKYIPLSLKYKLDFVQNDIPSPSYIYN